MIEIIKKGTRKNQECNFCGCIFSYEEEDIITKTKGFYKAEPFSFIKSILYCPQCKKEIILKETR